MSQTILVRRGLKANLPVLSEGEIAFCTDTLEYFIGSTIGNILLSNSTLISKLEEVVGKTGKFIEVRTDDPIDLYEGRMWIVSN